MPSITNQTMTVQLAGTNVTIAVTYNANFSAFDRFLAQGGLRFRERIRVIGEDPGTATDMILHTFPLQNIPVTSGTTPLTVPRSRSLTVPRASLQEDVGSDDDEIDCRIEIIPLDLPVVATATTAQQVLAG
jgi:hypothetical protein